MFSFVIKMISFYNHISFLLYFQYMKNWTFMKLFLMSNIFMTGIYSVVSVSIFILFSYSR